MTEQESSMVESTQGNLLKADVEALVNTVNCVGFMGKGIALQFKQAYPENFRSYERACKAQEVQPGRMFVVPSGELEGPRFIINFPTKRHWRGDSRLEDIDSGLRALIDEVRRLNIKSIAVPPLGCGNGGLDWGTVRPRIITAFAKVPDVRVLLFEPAGAPPAHDAVIRTPRPRLTVGRALLIKLLEQYSALEDRKTLLEVQKLAYLMQEAGQPLSLQYREHLYGPYAPNLKKVLEAVEGHYLTGYVDNEKPDVEIDLLPGATDEAAAFLSSDEAARARLARVGKLIEGYETPYGMELLATVHWAGLHQNARGPAEAVERVHAWSPRKAKLFRPSHIHAAWERLASQGWLRAPAEAS
ncbi:MAG: macro domain-containing protein [Archangium sp.]|nr:macro domain-containing protein [Archangium sp.]